MINLYVKNQIMRYTCDLINIGPVLGIHFGLNIGADDERSVW